MRKVYGYCRTALADEEEIIKRTELVKKYCEGNGLTLAKCFCDNGVNGFDIGEGFKQLMGELENGDMVVVRPQPNADDGQIVVARIGDEATVKRLRRRNGEIWLMPENENYAPIDGRDAEIIGIVKAVIREL